MEKNETEIANSSNNETETTENTEADATQEEVDVEALKKENATLKAQKEHWRSKVEAKKEAPKEVPKEIPKEASEGNLSLRDQAILMRSVHPDDFDYALSQAKLYGSLSEALNQDEVKAGLYVRNEKRQTAIATNTDSKRRSTNKISDEVLLERAQKGELPENDADISRLNKLQWELKRGKRK